MTGEDGTGTEKTGALDDDEAAGASSSSKGSGSIICFCSTRGEISSVLFAYRMSKRKICKQWLLTICQIIDC